jgi:hypothetical protein
MSAVKHKLLQSVLCVIKLVLVVYCSYGSRSYLSNVKSNYAS